MGSESIATDGGLGVEAQSVLDEIEGNNVDFLRIQFTDALSVPAAIP